MRVLLTGGGTGGHIFPLLAIIDELKELSPNSEFYWFGSRRMEWQVVPDAGINGLFLPYTFAYRRMSVKALSYYARILPVWLTGFPFRSALRVIREFQPDILIASGSYVSFPCLSSAVLSQLPYVLVEINSVPGRVNLLFASGAKRVLCATEAVAQSLYKLSAPGSIRVVGFPARKFRNLNAREYFQVPEGVPLVVISGGSSGAEHINRVFLSLAEESSFLRKFGESVAFVHQWGRVPTEKEFARFVMFKSYKALAFDPNLPALYPQADLFIGRAGAATICDLISARLPSLLVPYPYHADKQQYKNAELLAKAGCAKIVEEADFMPDTLGEVLDELLSAQTNKLMREAFKAFPTDGAKIAAQEIYSLLESGA